KGNFRNIKVALSLFYSSKTDFQLLKKHFFLPIFPFFRCRVFLLQNMQFRGCFCINIHVKGGSSVVEGSTLSDGKSVKDIYILK
ncbi:MAG: hypothetical protein IKI48_05115, partial [Prevotella sp.]|nr:hypothetical protein [Prevotella sp.]